MRRFSFLTLFLGCLSVAFAAVVVMRVRSYQRRPAHEAAPAATTAAAPAAGHVSSTAAIVNGAAVQEQATVAATASSRARLREELLRQPIPAAAGHSGAAPVAAPVVATPRPQPQPQQQQTRSAQTATSRPSPTEVVQTQGGTRPHESTERSPSKDPNSDSAPPQLLSIAFDPPQVEDGQEARVVMTAVDDLSGIRGISGTITSPTGKALQGFAGQRDGETNRYVGRIVVPKNGEEGIWRVNNMTLSDNASNSVMLSIASGTLPANSGLRVVSSQSDSTPPVLRSAHAERATMHIGEQNPLFIEAEDDKSGVNLVSAVFVSPGKKARIGAGCTHGEGDMWRCEMALPACIDCGIWQLEQVTLQDKANNLATYRLDNPIVASVRVNISGDSCDSEAPRLHGILLDQSIVTMGTEPSAVTVTMTASDDACGVEGVSAQYAGPVAGAGGFFALLRAGNDQTWIGKIPLDPHAARGTWRVISVQITDRGHNLRIYQASEPLLANATFQVR